ncbi:hypothetical protein [Streptomyces pseudogriseolus]|uniref:hypothetical protein n=1 Tax=Streptomyces pseudogriseolus TaxID=36817 RepID=UPI001CE3822F|nr:hypothetical protein [Streptomyces pseudogriseolus]
MKLKPVGFYSDTEFGEPGQPTLEGSCGKFSGPLEKMVSYLRSAHTIMMSGSGVYDELASGKPLIGALAIQTDGNWVWPSSYPYYVEKYRMEVPAGLLDLASSRNWIPPDFPDDADFESLMPFEG